METTNVDRGKDNPALDMDNPALGMDNPALGKDNPALDMETIWSGWTSVFISKGKTHQRKTFWG